MGSTSGGVRGVTIDMGYYLFDPGRVVPSSVTPYDANSVADVGSVSRSIAEHQSEPGAASYHTTPARQNQTQGPNVPSPQAEVVHIVQVSDAVRCRACGRERGLDWQTAPSRAAAVTPSC